MIARAWHGIIAASVLFALVLQVVIAVRAPGTPYLAEPGRLAGASLGGRLLRLVSFFTVQSNILAAVTSAQLAARPDRDGPAWRVVRLDALFGITVTGIVYTTVLAPIHVPHGWEETSSNFVVHYQAPVMMALGWLLFGPRPRIGLTVLLWSLVWPVVWFGYTLVRGAIWDWYPYPFVDVTTHGYGRVLLNALLVTLVLSLVAMLFRIGDRTLRPAPVVDSAPIAQPA